MAVGTALSQIQTALYMLLKNDATLTSQINGVFDQTPTDEPFPYVVIGDAQETPFDTFPKMGRIANETIGIFSQHTGFLEVLSIGDRIIFLTNRYNFGSLGPYTSVYSMYKNSSTKRDSDGITREFSLHFDILLEET